MMKKLLVLVMFASTLLLFGGNTAMAASLPTGSPIVAGSLFTNSKEEACGGVQANDNPVSCDQDTTGNRLNDIIKGGLNILSIIVALAAVIMIIVGGFKYITSQGEGANTANARNTILYAIIGLAIAGIAQFIVRFVIVQTRA